MIVIKTIVRIIIAVIELVAAAIESVTRTFSGGLAIMRVYLHREYDYLRWLKRDLADCNTILELGCGSNSPILKIGYGPKCDAVDIFAPYVEKHCRQKDYRRCWQENILDMGLPEKSYEAVVIFDVLEHLPKATVDKISLFKRLEKCATKKIILFTPNGYVDNDEVDGDPYQRHVSAWEPEDYLKRGYTVKGATGLRYILGKASRPKYHPYSFFEIVAMLSKPYIYNHPKIAWHSYAVKVLK